MAWCLHIPPISLPAPHILTDGTHHWPGTHTGRAGPREYSSLSHHAIQIVPLPSALRCGQEGSRWTEAQVGKDFKFKLATGLSKWDAREGNGLLAHLGLDYVPFPHTPGHCLVWSWQQRAFRIQSPEWTVPYSKPAPFSGGSSEHQSLYYKIWSEVW